MSNVTEAAVKFLDGSFTEAAEMFHEGAREGDILASFNYGYCLWRGIGVPKNVSEAKSFFTFAREMKGGEACYNIAIIYIQGDGVAKKLQKSNGLYANERRAWLH